MLHAQNPTGYPRAGALLLHAAAAGVFRAALCAAAQQHQHRVCAVSRRGGTALASQCVQVLSVCFSFPCTIPWSSIDHSWQTCIASLSSLTWRPDVGCCKAVRPLHGCAVVEWRGPAGAADWAAKTPSSLRWTIVSAVLPATASCPSSPSQRPSMRLLGPTYALLPSLCCSVRHSETFVGNRHM